MREPQTRFVELNRIQGYAHVLSYIILKIWLFGGIFLTLYGMYYNKLWKFVELFLVSYFAEQIFFMAGHMHLHTQFKEIVYDKMPAFVQAAYCHHYIDSLLFSKLSNVEYYVPYLFTTRVNHLSLRNPLLTSLIFSVGACLIYVLWMFDFSGFYLDLIGLFTFYLAEYEAPLLWILYYIVICLVADYSIAITVTGLTMFLFYYQAHAHRWYHTLHKDKKQLNPLSYHIMNLLDYLKISSTQIHKLHHAHNIDSKETAEVWYDCWVPQFLNNIFENHWKYLNTTYCENKTNMCDNHIKWCIFVRIIVISAVILNAYIISKF